MYLYHYLRGFLSGQVKMDVRGAGHRRVRAAGRGGRGRGGGGALAVIDQKGRSEGRVRWVWERVELYGG